MSSETQELIARLWTRFAPLARDRVSTLALYLRHESPVSSSPGLDAASDAAAEVVGPTHAQARQAAHDLVGSLGSYGRPRGSELAAAVEALLADGTRPLSEPDRREACRLVDELEREVGS